VRFKDLDGKDAEEHLGDYPAMTPEEARASAAEIRNLKAKGINRGKQKEEAVKEARAARLATVSALADDFLANGCVGIEANTKRNYESDIRLYVKPLLGARTWKEVRRADVIAIANKLKAERSARIAWGFVAATRRIFSYAEVNEWTEYNPARGLKEHAPKITKRTRRSSNAELKAVWAALEVRRATKRGAWASATAIQLAILTGQRREECAGIAKAHVDFKKKIWTQPADEKKMKQEALVPLTAWTCALLKEACDRSECDSVFPGEDGEALDPKVLTRLWGRIRKEVGFKDLRLHDQRRTLASGIAELGFDESLISRILTHEAGGSVSEATRVYQLHAYVKQRRKAYEAWERELKKIVGLEAPKKKAKKAASAKAKQGPNA